MKISPLAAPISRTRWIFAFAVVVGGSQLAARHRTWVGSGTVWRAIFLDARQPVIALTRHCCSRTRMAAGAVAARRHSN